MSAFLERVPAGSVRTIRAAWMEAWRAQCPEADPLRAARLIGPIGALRRAVIYQGFLDGIEPSERCYHEVDVPNWLRETAALVDARS